VSTIPTVIAPGVPGASGGPIYTKGEIEREQKDEKMGQNYLEHIAKPMQSAGIKVECVVLAGMPGETIVSYAEANEIDLIAIATHGRSGVRRLIFGSVADFVLRNSHLPILLIKPIP
jgi:nucleotide-binding universal stress UspA family protein